MYMDQLFHNIKRWSVQTFGLDHGPKVPITHLIHEAKEILAEPGDIEEYADAAILLIDGVWRAGFTYRQFLDAIAAKHEKNQRRTWHRDPDGTFQHDK